MIIIQPFTKPFSVFMTVEKMPFENIVGKEEIARNEQFLLFPQCFLLYQIIACPFVHIFDKIYLLAAELEEPKIGISHKGLTTMFWNLYNEQFLLFPQCFLLYQIIACPFVHIFDIIYLFIAELEEPKNGISHKGLTTMFWNLRKQGPILESDYSVYSGCFQLGQVYNFVVCLWLMLLGNRSYG